MEFGDSIVNFNIFDAMKYPREEHPVFCIDVIDEVVDDVSTELIVDYPDFSSYHDIVALKFLLKKADAKPRVIPWMLLLQEFDIEIKDRSGVENLVADHLSCITHLPSNPAPIQDDFPDEQLLQLQAQILKLKSESKYYVWDDPYLWRFCNDQVIRIYVPPDIEFQSVLQFCDASACGGHFGPQRTARKVLDSGLSWPSLSHDAYLFSVEYVSNWVEAKATRTDDSAMVVDFVKSNIFYRFGIPKAIISDQVELCDKQTGKTFTVNGDRLKLFHEGPQQQLVEAEIRLTYAPYPA
ncbi:uncharacterized protein LOC133290587 [Gastrolobium bilobum]|uniref:uncharacterized protein LOC133290587 n=1 Tax=Gastrolobium bilobum TaxID=150636 RepID=UPI002AB2B3D5|nr:uncharacterized protein LOC133290587 [Gastrolobium bilobum]